MPDNEWDPLKELVGVHQQMNRLFERALQRRNFDAQEGVGSWSPEADVYEQDGSLVFELELAGLRQDVIDLRVDGDELVVEGERTLDRGEPDEHFHRVERTYGTFARRFHLPSTVDRQRIAATYRNGVLRVELPTKRGEGPRAMKVPIG